MANTRRGVRRLLIALTAIYWIVAVVVAFLTYIRAFDAAYMPIPPFFTGAEADAMALAAFNRARHSGVAVAVGSLIAWAACFIAMALVTVAARWVARGFRSTAHITSR